MRRMLLITLGKKLAGFEGNEECNTTPANANRKQSLEPPKKGKCSLCSYIKDGKTRIVSASCSKSAYGEHYAVMV